LRIQNSRFNKFYETFMSQRDTKDNENVIPAKAGIQKAKSLDSRLHGNDGLEVFSGERLSYCITVSDYNACQKELDSE
jgi:hypothetical protein